MGWYGPKLVDKMVHHTPLTREDLWTGIPG